jgi:cellobiose-specific phosphotransferase system component IIC
LAVRIVLTLAGAAGLVISAFMDWAQGNAASDIGVRSLWSTNFNHPGNDWLTTIAAILVALGLLAILGMAPRTGWLTSLAGALGIALFVMFLVQLYRADLSVNDLDPGAWVGLAGGIVALIGGFFGTRTAVVASRPVAVAS